MKIDGEIKIIVEYPDGMKSEYFLLPDYTEDIIKGRTGFCFKTCHPTAAQIGHVKLFTLSGTPYAN